MAFNADRVTLPSGKHDEIKKISFYKYKFKINKTIFSSSGCVYG